MVTINNATTVNGKTVVYNIVVLLIEQFSVEGNIFPGN